VIADLNELDAPEDLEWLGRMAVLLMQDTDIHAGAERFALLQFAPNGAPAAAGQRDPARNTDQNASDCGSVLAEETLTGAHGSLQAR
jgi:hypothetical protein